MTNFYPAYMEKSIQFDEHSELRYNEKFIIGMLYVNGYKKNPVHYDCKSVEDLIKKAENDYKEIKSLLKDSKQITSKKNGRLKESTKVHR